MSIPYFPLYVADYEADTGHLSLAEDGAYTRLLRLCWRTPGCSIPDDDAWIIRRLRVDAATFYAVVRPILDEFFKRRLGRWFNPRLSQEFDRITTLSERRSAAGKLGGRPRKALNDNASGKSKAKANGKHLEPYPEPEPEVSTSVDTCPPVDDVAEAVNAYNLKAQACGWPEVQKLTPQRRAALKARLAEAGGSEGWRIALDKAGASDFLTGQTAQGFRASFDFLTRQSSFAKLMEGNYDNRTNNGPSGGRQNRPDPALENILRLTGFSPS